MRRSLLIGLLALAPALGHGQGPGEPRGGPPGLVGVSSCTVLTGAVTVFMGPGACADQLEEMVEQPLPGLTFTGMRCTTSAAIGAGRALTVTARTGPCGTLADSPGFFCTLTGDGASRSSCTTGPKLLPVAVGRCFTLEVAPSGGAFVVPAAVNCTMERSA